MRDVDRALQSAVKTPDDVAARCALADLLRADEDGVLAFAVESDTGPDLLGRLKRSSELLREPVSVRLLWYVYHIEPKLVGPPIVNYPGPQRNPVIVPLTDVVPLPATPNRPASPWVHRENNNETIMQLDGVSQVSGVDGLTVSVGRYPL